MNTTLVIMAAGMGSRFSKHEIKQLSKVGPSGEIIMDYSIYDAKEAGFNKVVFIIRKEIEEAFNQAIGNRIRQVIDVEYVYQELEDLPVGYVKAEGRTKPFGTGHAILMCKGVVNEPFAIINADDYYGKQAFRHMHDYLVEHHGGYDYCMSGFVLKNTLSDHGAVSRGICKVKNGYLEDVEEIKNIIRTDSGAKAIDADGRERELDKEGIVSMNMWGVTPEFIGVLEDRFKDFLDHMQDPLKDEYLLPEIMNSLITTKKCKVACLETRDAWFGVTYEADKQYVQESFQALVEKGDYPTPLF